MRAVFAIARLVLKELFRKKDFYVVLVLIGVILLYAQGLRFYDTANVSRYLADLGLSLIYFFSTVLCAGLAARQAPSEIQNRTAPLLLAKPLSRLQFVLGKYLGALLASLSAFTVFYALFLLILFWKAGTVAWPVAAQAFYLFCLGLAVLCAMTSALSYGLTVSANVTVSLVLYALVSLYGPQLKESARSFFQPLRGLCELSYYALPHFEFFDLRQRLVHGWDAVPLPFLGLLTLYASFYAVFFLSLAYAAFRRRPL